MKLSNNLSLYEVTRSSTAKRRGINNTPGTEAMSNLKNIADNIFQPIREYFGVPIYVSSGFRSKELNKAIGSRSTSDHCTGCALDIDMDGRDQISSEIGKEVTNADVFYYILYNLPFNQLIWEFGTDDNPAWVHVSLRPSKNRNQVLRATRNSDGIVNYEPFEK